MLDRTFWRSLSFLLLIQFYILALLLIWFGHDYFWYLFFWLFFIDLKFCIGWIIIICWYRFLCIFHGWFLIFLCDLCTLGVLYSLHGLMTCDVFYCLWNIHLALYLSILIFIILLSCSLFASSSGIQLIVYEWFFDPALESSCFKANTLSFLSGSFISSALRSFLILMPIVFFSLGNVVLHCWLIPHDLEDYI